MSIACPPRVTKPVVSGAQFAAVATPAVSWAVEARVTLAVGLVLVALALAGIPVGAKKGGIGVVEGDALLGDQLMAKGIVCMERPEEGEEGDLVGAILRRLVNGRDAVDPATGIVDTAI